MCECQWRQLGKWPRAGSLSGQAGIEQSRVKSRDRERDADGDEGSQLTWSSAEPECESHRYGHSQR